MQKKKSGIGLFLVYFLLMFVYSLSSEAAGIAFPSLIPLRKPLTFLVYLPFFFVALYKFLLDVRAIRQGQKLSVVSTLYYFFFAFFFIVSAFRLVTRMEVKESLYWALILAGSVGLYILLRDNIWAFGQRDYLCFVLCTASCVLASHFLFIYVLNNVFVRAPININLTSGVLGLLLPPELDFLADERLSARNRWWAFIVTVLSIFVIVSTGSRAIFWLTVLILAVKLALPMRQFLKRAKPIAFSLAAAGLLIAVAVAAPDETVRTALARETGVSFILASEEPNGQEETLDGSSGEISADQSQEQGEVGNSVNESQGTENLDHPSSETSIEQVQQQIGYSDSMRMDLIKWGLAQIKQNPLFGTGDVLYPYGMSEDRIVEQSSHNFLIESMVAFGAIGTVLLGALIVLMLKDVMQAQRASGGIKAVDVTVWMAVFYFFAFGFVEPTVFEQMTLPVFIIILAEHQKILTPAEMAEQLGRK